MHSVYVIMRRHLEIILAFLMATDVLCITFHFEAERGYKAADYLDLSLRRMENPEPLPKPKLKPYIYEMKSIQQGIKQGSDVRVYRKSFKDAAKASGQYLTANGQFKCIISYLTVETEQSLPILLRGGVGYSYFTIVIRAKPGEELEGRILAFCPKGAWQDDDSK